VYVDSHCHLNFPELRAEFSGVLARMHAAGVSHALSVCTKLEEFDDIHSMVLGTEHVFASVGVHPSETGCREVDCDTLGALSQRARVVAIGETGLDYYWHKEAPDWQRERFCQHIQAARETAKPLIIHTRDAAADTLRLMRQERAREAGGVMHCFTDTLETAQAAMEMGFHISFSGIVTFKRAQALREVAAAVPMELLLIETDSPYLAPVPHRGKTNEPSFVPHVAAEIARIKGMPVEDVARITSENFFRLFRIPHP